MTRVQRASGGWGGVYFLCMIGAWVFYWQHSHRFWGHVWGLIEGVFWPALVTYRALLHLY